MRNNPINEATEIRELGTPEDIAFAQSLYPNKKIYACLRVSDIARKALRNEVKICLSIFCCFAPCIYLGYINQVEDWDNTHYIVTEDSVIFHKKDFDPTCAWCDAAGRETKQIQIESILTTKTDSKGEGCVCIATPFVDIVTAADGVRKTDDGNVRKPNYMYVDDVLSLDAIINQIRQKNKNNVVDPGSGAIGVQRVFVATEQAPTEFKLVIIDSNETMKSLKQKIQDSLTLMYVNSISLVSDGINVQIDDVTGIQNNDKVIVS